MYTILAKPDIYVFIAAFLLTIASADAATTRFRGGSDFIFYGLDGCNRDKYMVAPNYARDKQHVDSVLASMINNGQRRLRISIPLPVNQQRAPGEALSQDYKNSVTAFLAGIKRAGFEEVEVTIGDEGFVPPFNWKEWDENSYLKRWQDIVEIRPLLVESGLKYRVDLLNEAIPAANQNMLLRYSRRLWTDYTKRFGKDDTVGFSIITTPQQDRFAPIPAVYGKNPPPVFDLHIYGNSYDSFVNAHKRLVALGYGNIPWIIGEAFYNDADEARDIARAITDTHQNVLFLLQWPLRRANSCNDVDVVPLDFKEYIKLGF